MSEHILIDVVITDPEAFIKGSYTWALHIVQQEDRHIYEECKTIAQFTLDIPTDTTEIRQLAVDRLEEKLQQTRANAQVEEERIKARISKLLALEAPREVNYETP